MNFSLARRQFARLGACLAALCVLPTRAALGKPDALTQRAQAISGQAAIQTGRVTINTPRLADNGHSVPINIRVESAMTERDYVRRIALVSESNPRPIIATFHLSAKSGLAEITTRIRLNRTQYVMAIAELSDGTFWSDRAEVIVTESACLDAD